jgi:hypothetical protein
VISDLFSVSAENKRNRPSKRATVASIAVCTSQRSAVDFNDTDAELVSGSRWLFLMSNLPHLSLNLIQRRPQQSFQGLLDRSCFPIADHIAQSHCADRVRQPPVDISQLNPRLSSHQLQRPSACRWVSRTRRLDRSRTHPFFKLFEDIHR